jgi:hypothetical protein
MTGRCIDDAIAEKQQEFDRFDEQFRYRIMGEPQMREYLARQAKLRGELEELKRKRDSGMYARRGE